MHSQVDIPTAGPSYRTCCPRDIIRVSDGIYQGYIQLWGQVLQVADYFCAVSIGLGPLLDALRVDLEANDTETLELLWVMVVLQPDADVVVYVILPILFQSNWKAVHIGVGLIPSAIVAHGSWKVVYEPIDLVLIIDHALEALLVLRLKLALAEIRAGRVYIHPNVIHRVLDRITQQNLAEILSSNMDLLGGAIWQKVEPIWQLRFHRGQLVHLQLNMATLLILYRSHPRQVESVC
mmetsp:Transcript_151098/g.263347  ORF Transcript_151098/g.263347 Transcript_151098/m.263347 type:complete len:236 (-) Transcript_151098:197-904(-)